MTTQPDTEGLIAAARAFHAEAREAVKLAEATLYAQREAHALEGTPASKAGLTQAQRILKNRYEDEINAAARISGLQKRLEGERLAAAIERRAPLDARMDSHDALVARLTSSASALFGDFDRNLAELDARMREAEHAGRTLANEATAVDPAAGYRRRPRSIVPISNHSGMLNNLRRLSGPEGFMRLYPEGD
jgi:hypothetical protein